VLADVVVVADEAILVTTSTYSKDAHAMETKHKYQLSLRDYTDVANGFRLT